MNPAIGRMLERYSRDTIEENVAALREILQQLALLGLWRSKFFERAAFYGGSALRILYGLDRYSEDLDFSLLAPRAGFFSWHIWFLVGTGVGRLRLRGDRSSR